MASVFGYGLDNKQSERFLIYSRSDTKSGEWFDLTLY